MLSLIPFVVLAAGITAALALYTALRREVRLLSRRQWRKIEQILARLDDATLPSPGSGIDPARSSLRPGFNRIHRVEALRLLRRGEATSQIAAALGIPASEVELLIRVHGIPRDPHPEPYRPAPPPPANAGDKSKSASSGTA